MKDKYNLGMVLGTFAYVFGTVTTSLNNAHNGNLYIAIFGMICALIGIGIFTKLVIEYLDSNEVKKA